MDKLWINHDNFIDVRVVVMVSEVKNTCERVVGSMMVEPTSIKRG